MHTFSVVVVLPGQYQKYRDYWIRGKTLNAKGEAIDPGQLSISVTVAAQNKTNAEAQVAKNHPGGRIDRKATNRMG